METCLSSQCKGVPKSDLISVIEYNRTAWCPAKSDKADLFFGTERFGCNARPFVKKTANIPSF